MIKRNEIIVFPHSYDLFQYAAKDFSQRAITAINAKGIFSVVLSGGNTPKLFFDMLIETDNYQKNIPWNQIQFFFGDERYVSSGNTQSNYHTAYLHLFSKLPIKPENIYRISTDFNAPIEAAKDYENRLRKAFGIKEDAFPPFDLTYLGLGDNAHTASLMPFSDVVTNDSNNQLVASLFVPEFNMYRITLTPPAINHSKDIIFLVTGANKATAVWEVLEGQSDSQRYPAQLIHSEYGKTIWYLDQSAAEKLNIKG